MCHLVNQRFLIEHAFHPDYIVGCHYAICLWIPHPIRIFSSICRISHKHHRNAPVCQFSSLPYFTILHSPQILRFTTHFGLASSIALCQVIHQTVLSRPPLILIALKPSSWGCTPERLNDNRSSTPPGVYMTLPSLLDLCQPGMETLSQHCCGAEGCHDS